MPNDTIPDSGAYLLYMGTDVEEQVEADNNTEKRDYNTVRSAELTDLLNRIKGATGSYAPISIQGKTIDLGGSALVISKSVRIYDDGIFKNGWIRILNTSKVEISGINFDGATIEIFDSADVTIINNNMFNSTDCGIKCNAEKKGCEDVLIKDNKIYGARGYAAIFVGGNQAFYKGLIIDGNVVRNTENFGIEFFGNNLNYKGCVVKSNYIWDTGSIRKPGSGAGCGGIFSNLSSEGISVVGNDVRRICEVGIEGTFGLVKDNYIEDTGKDQLNFPIGDSSGIYQGGKQIINNVIVNPGKDGGIYGFSSEVLESVVYSGNIIKNDFELWKPNKNYSIGDLVVSDDCWYVCKQSGIAGATPISGKIGNIVDGSCKWDYKKPMGNKGIDLNASLRNIILLRNEIFDVQNAFASGPWLDKIKILGNVHTCSDKLKKGDFFGGYGSRAINNLEFFSLRTKTLINKNPLFESWKLNLPEYWNVYNGTVTKSKSEYSTRDVPKISTTSTNRAVTLVQGPINFRSNEAYLIEIRMKTNCGVNCSVLDSKGYLGEFIYTDTSQNWNTISGIIDSLNRSDSLTFQFSTYDKRGIYSGSYIIFDYIAIYGI